MASSSFPILRGPDVQQSRTQDNVNGVLQPVAKAVMNTPIMGAPAPVWVLPDLLNGWVNFGGAFATAAFHKDCLGYVHLRGTIKSGTVGSNAFVLPMGYRPLSLLNQGIQTDTGLGSIAVFATGNLQMSGGNGFANLDFFTFLAEQ